jgi:hypothetical protein
LDRTAWIFIVFLILVWAFGAAGMVAAFRQQARQRKARAELDRRARAALEVPPRVTVYGTEQALAEARGPMSGQIHSCLVEFFGKAADDRYRPYLRFIAVTVADERSGGRVAVDVELCASLTEQSKRRLLTALYGCIGMPQIEIRLLETLVSNWMIDGRILTEDGPS